MKKNDPVVPKKIEELNKYQIIAAPYIKLNKLRLQVAANDLTDLDKIINDDQNEEVDILSNVMKRISIIKSKI